MTDTPSNKFINDNAIKLPKAYEDYWTRKFGLTPDQFDAALKSGRLAGLAQNLSARNPGR